MATTLTKRDTALLQGLSDVLDGLVSKLAYGTTILPGFAEIIGISLAGDGGEINGGTAVGPAIAHLADSVSELREVHAAIAGSISDLAETQARIATALERMLGQAADPSNDET